MLYFKRLLFSYLLLHLVAAKADLQTDSLLNVVKTGSVKAKVDALNELCLLFYYNEPEKAKNYAFKSIKAARKADYIQGLGKAYNRLGIVYDVTGNYDSAIVCYNEALLNYQEVKYSKGTGAAYNNLGLINWKRGKLNEAATYFFKALPFFTEAENMEYLANVLNNISLVYEKTSDHRKAITYALKALHYYEKLNDQENIGGCYTNLSVSYESNGMLDSSKYYSQQAIACHLKSNNLFGLSIAYNDYGVILDLCKDHKAAREYLFKSLQLKKELHEEEGIASLYINIAENARLTADRANNLYYLGKAKEISLKNNFLTKLKTIYSSLAEFYKEQNNSDSVFIYMELSNAVKDSIYTKEFKGSLAEAQAKYETTEKELRIRDQEYQLIKKNYYIIILISVLFVLGLAFYTLASRYKLKQQARLQNEIIKQQDIATRAVISAEENERKRVASDLHDSVGQMLSAIKLNLSALSPHVLEAKALHFEKVMGMVDESCKEVRAISHNLMPNSLLKSGLVSAVKEFIHQIGEGGLKVNLEAIGLNQRLDNNTEAVLYRVIQECVNNVVKHAKATSLDIQITKDEEGIAITIEDNGVGFDTSLITEGIGLKNLRSRIEFLKGNIDMSSSPEKGTLIAIFIPKTI